MLIDRVERFAQKVTALILGAFLLAISVGPGLLVIYLVWHFARKYW